MSECQNCGGRGEVVFGGAVWVKCDVCGGYGTVGNQADSEGENQ